ncbi:DNA primase [Alphaproteobacteria bacterium SO-S41]|nr:DNA primase [Alphaproteobacteria bacterium SO-S41]
MAFDEAFLDELKARVRVADVVGRRVKLVRKGREFMGLCPFHSEKSPSFSVNEQKGFYHCFGCGAHGDAIKFVCETEGLNFREAVERLAGEAGLQMPEESPFQREREEKRRTLYDVIALAQVFFRERLAGSGGSAARAYIAKRELDAATVERFGMGLAPEGRTTLIQHLTQKGVPVGEIVEAGLAVVPEGQSEPIDFFRNRLTIPIGDSRGRIIAFGARTLLPDGKPKYINTGETPLFHKGRTLYNLDRARKPAHDAQTIIVAEGYLDVIALAKAGIENAVAPLGTALTEDQIGLLWRVAPEPILCFDGDAAGQRAAHKAIDRALPLLKPGQSLRFAFLPDGLDPDDLIKRDGAAAMEAVLKAARPLIEVFWERERDLADTSTPERRAALQHRIEGAADSIADAVVRDHYKRELKDRLWGLFRPQRPVRAAGVGIPLRQLGGGALKPSLRRPPPPRGRFGAVPPPVYGQNPPSLRNSAAVKTGGTQVPIRAEAELAFLLVRYPGVVLQDYEAVEQISFLAPHLEVLKIEVLHFAVENHVLDESVLKDHLCAQGLAETLSGLENRDAFALDRAASAGLSPDEVLVRWREAVASQRRMHALSPAARRARGDWARDQSEGARRSLEEAEAALKRSFEAASGDGEAEL